MKFNDIQKFSTNLLKSAFPNRKTLNKLSENEGNLLFNGKEINGGGIENLINFDNSYDDYIEEEETIIGKWINGKPIYRNVITCQYKGQGTTWCNIHTDDWNIEEIINMKGYSNNAILYGYGKITNGYIQCYMINAAFVIGDKVVIEYTKTTDEENSFTDDMIIQDINSVKIQDHEDTPVGHIMSFMGKTAPKHYLICDGTEYNIADYPYLSKYILEQFGSYNHFGGDGTTTFAVPDLRGEFLRGSGTNSHENQGSGGEVGEHQDGTLHVSTSNSISSSNIIGALSNGKTSSDVENPDVRLTRTGFINMANCAVRTGINDAYGNFTSRPTNTSVLYCIKYEPTYYINIGTSVYKETIFEGTLVTGNTTLLKPITEFDEIEIITKEVDTSTIHRRDRIRASVDSINFGAAEDFSSYLHISSTQNYNFIFFHFDNENSLTIDNNSMGKNYHCISKITGIKY